MTIPEPLTQAQAKGNLDLLAASHGQYLADTVIEKAKAASEAENLITRALGVLQGQGIYAVFLLLAAREKEPGAALADGLYKLIDTLQVAQPLAARHEGLAALRESTILTDLPTLLLVKRTLERALTYARYHAKAKAGAANA